MNRLFVCIPLLILLALVVLFSLLPATPELLICKACSSTSPYLPLMGTGYFTLLGVLWLLFPRFPGPYMARGGLLWSVFLALSLSYVKGPVLCWACLLVHSCHILLWTVWVFTQRVENTDTSSCAKEKLCLLIVAPISMVALFASLNLTFMNYSFKREQPFFTSSLQAGDKIPDFQALTVLGQPFSSGESKVLINFMSPECPYCKEQKPIVQAVISELPKNSYRCINISPVFSQEFLESYAHFEWIEDKERKLQDLFKISVYPTLLVVDAGGTITKIFTGVSEQFERDLLEALN